ncbi:pseudouridine synthase [Basilea psittacipulmonis DSM 24701]|uniref:Pseudouridine synthase n=1 Tax=Basilea psittacipulmonis DSM 24701 TaxID=1072685 RepID=A0A077DBN7_9BURK|nr:pseudouridine synthase [Basilea psittacipulmonis DSM 24701]
MSQELINIDDNEHEFRLSIDEVPDRLDKVLARLLPQFSRARLQKWIEMQAVLVNGKEAKVKQIVGPDDVIWVQEQMSEEEMAFEPDENVVFEVIEANDDFIVVNKPVGLVTHPGAGNWRGTLLNGLLYQFPELSGIPRAGIVHRLDKDTSGLLVVARTLTAQTDLVRQLQARTVGRTYLALVHGVTNSEGEVSLPIGRDPRNPVKMSSQHPIAPKEAWTYYKTVGHGICEDMAVSKIECQLKTGRTHQIRVHMSSLGHSLLGDTLYAGRCIAQANRQMLHAYQLRFLHPVNGQICSFEADIPNDMQTVIDNIKWQ